MSVAQMKVILKDLKDAHNLDACAVVSRNGTGIAWELQDDSYGEMFATLSATILGASEVMYSGLGKSLPDRVVIESESGTMVAIGLGTKAVLVALSKDENPSGLVEAVKDSATKIKEVLKNEKD